jgi:hypothetical protein
MATCEKRQHGGQSAYLWRYQAIIMASQYQWQRRGGLASASLAAAGEAGVISASSSAINGGSHHLRWRNGENGESLSASISSMASAYQPANGGSWLSAISLALAAKAGVNNAAKIWLAIKPAYQPISKWPGSSIKQRNGWQ